jgi:hypothetical protein
VNASIGINSVDIYGEEIPGFSRCHACYAASAIRSLFMADDARLPQSKKAVSKKAQKGAVKKSA